jgi:hypothetical protein
MGILKRKWWKVGGIKDNIIKVKGQFTTSQKKCVQDKL